MMVEGKANILKNLLLTVPDSSREELMAMSEINSKKELMNELLKIYELELKIDTRNCQIPLIDLEDNKYYMEVMKYIRDSNIAIGNKRKSLKNANLVDNILNHSNCLIIDYLNPDSLETENVEKETLEEEKTDTNEVSKSREEIIEDLKEKKSITTAINTLIFEIRDVKFFKALFYEFSPDFKNYFKDENKLSNLVQQYVEMVKSEPLDNSVIIPISRIISFIINNDKLKLDSKDKDNNLKLLNRAIENLDKSKDNNQNKKGIVNSLNILITDIKREKNSAEKETIINLNQKYGITKRFSLEALNSIKKLKKIDDTLYTDLTDKYIVTFDCKKRTCCEDALSIEKLDNGNYLFGIYITDVSSYIKDNNILEQEAYKRGKTIYLPGEKFTMFPESLVYNQFSLKKNKNKYVIANLFEFSPQFDLINYEIEKAIINVSENISFKKLEQYLKSNQNMEINETYAKLVDVHNAIKKTTPILKNYYSTNNDVSIEDIISSFMVYLNYSSKEKYNELELPCLYKVYFMNNFVKEVTNTKEKDSSFVGKVIENLERYPYKSFYSTKESGHKGPNVHIHMPTTVPVRNFVAFKNQNLIRRYCIDKEKIKDTEIYKLEEQLEEISDYLNQKKRLVNSYIDEYQEINEDNKIKGR